MTLNLEGIVAGLMVSSLVVGLLFKFLKGKGSDMLVTFETAEIHKLLQLGPKDPDLAQFLHDVLLGAMKLAEKKLPLHGQGADRKQWVINTLCNDVPFFKGQEENLGELIDALATKEDAMLSQLVAEEERGTLAPAAAQAAAPALPPGPPNPPPPPPGQRVG